jgi:hypothetical protein
MRTTTDTYSHVMPALGRDTAHRMGDALGAAGTVTASVATTLAPETTKAAPRIEERPVGRVELRGLEPLTPTLPGRHDRVCSGSLRSRKRLDLRL